MSEVTFSSQPAWAASIIAATAAGVRAEASEGQVRGRTAQEEKYLQTVLQFWKTFEGEPPREDAFLALFTDDCIIRVGRNGDSVFQSKQLAKTFFKNFNDTRYTMNVTRTFVSGRVVVTEWDYRSWKKEGETPKQGPSYAGVFVFKDDKIWMWSDVEIEI